MGMIEYPKIETLYARDMEGSKKLIEGKFRDETLEFIKDCKFIWTEKIDGTNTSIYWDGHKVEYRGRTENAQIPTHLINYLNETFNTNESEEMFEQKFGETKVILFGEGYGPKIQKGGLYRDDVSFILFDVLILDAEEKPVIWLKREDVEDVAKAFGIDVVPIVGEGTLEEAVEYVKTHPKSTIGGKADMEGVVARPIVDLLDRRGKRVFVKIKYRDFS